MEKFRSHLWGTGDMVVIFGMLAHGVVVRGAAKPFLIIPFRKKFRVRENRWWNGVFEGWYFAKMEKFRSHLWGTGDMVVIFGMLAHGGVVRGAAKPFLIIPFRNNFRVRENRWWNGVFEGWYFAKMGQITTTKPPTQPAKLPPRNHQHNRQKSSPHLSIGYCGQSLHHDA